MRAVSVLSAARPFFDESSLQQPLKAGINVNHPLLPSQWEVSNRALEVLQSTKDAQGRSIEVCKIRLPPPLFRTYKEAEGLAVRRSFMFDLLSSAL